MCKKAVVRYIYSKKLVLPLFWQKSNFKTHLIVYLIVSFIVGVSSSVKVLCFFFKAKPNLECLTGLRKLRLNSLRRWLTVNLDPIVTVLRCDAIEIKRFEENCERRKLNEKHQTENNLWQNLFFFFVRHLKNETKFGTCWSS